MRTLLHLTTAALPAFLAARYSPRFASGFGWYARRLLRKQFHAVRVAKLETASDEGTPEPAGGVLGGADPLAQLDAYAGPVMVLVHHVSWWDPLVGLMLHQRFTPARQPSGPMDIAQLRNFRFFSRLGAFGIAPDDPASLGAMLTYVQGVFETNPRTSLWITPQGRFTDPRAPLVVRPGAAAIATKTPHLRVVSVAVEYAFWLDQRPEVFVRFMPVPAPVAGSEASRGNWQRTIITAMGANAAALAAAVITRDPNAFTTILGGGMARTNPIYDVCKRLMGQRTNISEEARRQADPRQRRAAQGPVSR